MATRSLTTVGVDSNVKKTRQKTTISPAPTIGTNISGSPKPTTKSTLPIIKTKSPKIKKISTIKKTQLNKTKISSVKSSARAVETSKSSIKNYKIKITTPKAKSSACQTKAKTLKIKSVAQMSSVTPTTARFKTRFTKTTNVATHTDALFTSNKQLSDASISHFNTANSSILTGIKRHPLGHLLLEKKLREVGFHGGISTDKKFLDRYSTDESIFYIHPQIILQPKNRRDVEIAVRLVAAETKHFDSLSLTPRAAGTGLSGGSLTDSIVIDVATHMHKVDDVQKTNDKITITCEPGAMWHVVEKKLTQHHAYLPPYTSSKDICTIGGSVANNAAGPDSLRYGHCASWVESLDVTLSDGHTYTVRPLSYKEFKTLIKKKENEYARIAREIFALIEQNEKEILNAKPKTKKNTAGYALWDVIPDGIAAFKTGLGTFDLTQLISGSQGTIGIITSVTMRALPIADDTTLLVIPLFCFEDVAKTIAAIIKYNPINIEIFDATTFDLALNNPDFFKQRLKKLVYYKALLTMYTNYHVRYRRRIPEFTILVTLDHGTLSDYSAVEIVSDINQQGAKARIVRNPAEAEMLWQIRRSSYILSKLQNPNKRPAAFLEDITVPPENLSRFLIEIKKLFKEFNVQAAMHGHGGNGHFHFYPLLDFTKKTTPLLVERMAERFYDTAIKYHGDICGEHNDGIIRTPYLNKMFSKKILGLFKQTEHICDHDDIFNPGKKVNPKFDIKISMRQTN